MKPLTLVFFLTVGFSSISWATEVDDTTNYYVEIKDSEDLLNAETQALIRQGLDRQRGCSRTTLALNMSSVLTGNLFFGTVESFAEETPAVDRSFVETGASIYRGSPYAGGFVDRVVKLGSVINLAGYHVGTDKVGHFMDMGYDLYTRAKKGASVFELLAQSRREQTGLWGKWMTGVKSYGDIASNFDGYRFWTDLIDEGANKFLFAKMVD